MLGRVQIEKMNRPGHRDAASPRACVHVLGQEVLEASKLVTDVGDARVQGGRVHGTHEVRLGKAKSTPSPSMPRRRSSRTRSLRPQPKSTTNLGLHSWMAGIAARPWLDRRTSNRACSPCQVLGLPLARLVIQRRCGSSGSRSFGTSDEVELRSLVGGSAISIRPMALEDPHRLAPGCAARR